MSYVASMPAEVLHRVRADPICGKNRATAATLRLSLAAAKRASSYRSCTVNVPAVRRVSLLPRSCVWRAATLHESFCAAGGTQMWVQRLLMRSAYPEQASLYQVSANAALAGPP